MRGCTRPDVPCHRVIAAGGRLGGYGGREALKRALLAAEGIAVAGGRVREIRPHPMVQASVELTRRSSTSQAGWPHPAV